MKVSIYIMRAHLLEKNTAPTTKTYIPMHLGVFQESSTRQIIVDLEESDNVWRQGCIHRLHKYVKVS